VFARLEFSGGGASAVCIHAVNLVGRFRHNHKGVIVNFIIPVWIAHQFGASFTHGVNPSGAFGAFCILKFGDCGGGDGFELVKVDVRIVDCHCFLLHFYSFGFFFAVNNRNS
jgi:hypothetical protein